MVIGAILKFLLTIELQIKRENEIVISSRNTVHMHDTRGSALPFSSLCLERMSQSGSEVPLDEFPVSLDTPTTLETGANCHEVHQRVSQFTGKLVPNGMIRSLRDLMTEARAKRELLLSKIV